MFKRLRGWDVPMEGSPTIRAAAAALALLAGAAPAAAPPARPVQYSQGVVREQVIIRFRQSAPARIDWKEGKGPKCIPTRAILGATLVGKNSVDLVLRGRQRVRAKLESSCPALDYYYGFYITPNSDGMVCEDRDIIRSRMGGACEIDRFRGLEPVVRR
ncbi:MAG: hypothetical protein QOG72_2312 [Sphingomonadales bacterium]|jgi:hypothetical protein|nr:hypothetical protein [Sphingomonadales bacterium]